MQSYSDIFFLGAAMVLFSMLSMNTARNFNQIREAFYRGEAEYRAIAVAQDEIDKVQWIYNDDDLDPDSFTYVYEDYPKKEVHTYGSSDQYSDTLLVFGNSTLIGDTGSQKRYQVSISVLIERTDPDVFVTLDYVKSYSY